MNPSQPMPQPVSGAHEELATWRLVSVAEMLRMIPRAGQGGTDRERGLAAVNAFYEHGIGQAAAEQNIQSEGCGAHSAEEARLLGTNHGIT